MNPFLNIIWTLCLKIKICRMKSSGTLKEYFAINSIFQLLIWLQKEHISIIKSAIVVRNELKENTFFSKKGTLWDVRYCYHNMTWRKIINELFMSSKPKKEPMTNLIRILTSDIAPILKEFTMNTLGINSDYFANSCELVWSLYEFFKYCFCCLGIGTRITLLLRVKNYLNNYFPCIPVSRAPLYAWNSHAPPSWR